MEGIITFIIGLVVIGIYDAKRGPAKKRKDKKQNG